MLILLPPSEGKATSGRGAAMDPTALSFPELGPARLRLLDTLEGLCGQPDDGPAREALGLSRHQGAEVLRNATLRRAPALPAGQVYTGVLYDALGLRTLDQAARRRAYRSVLVFSGLWGVVRLTDRIPPYRCPVGATLPGVGTLAGFWRGLLAPVLDGLTGSGLVLDLRSAGYTGMWRPTGERAERTVVVRVLHEQLVGGVTERRVVSHFNKATKGRLVRDLLAAGMRPDSPGELAAALGKLGHTVEGPVRAAGKPWRLDVVVTELGTGS